MSLSIAPVVLTKNDVTLMFETRNSCYYVRVPYAYGAATTGTIYGGVFDADGREIALHDSMRLAVQFARMGREARALDCLRQYVGKRLLVDGIKAPGTNRVRSVDVVATPKRAKVVVTSTPEDDEPMPRDNALVWVRHPRFDYLVPVMDARCFCGGLVDLTKPIDLDRIAGNSNNGYQAVHEACMSALSGWIGNTPDPIPYVAWDQRVLERTQSGKVVEVVLTRDEREYSKRVEGLCEWGWSLVDAIEICQQHAAMHSKVVADEFWVYLAH